MKIIHGLESEIEPLRRPKVALGTFDGVHLGHQRVLRELLAWARATDSEAVVLTFDCKQRDVLSSRPPEQITSLKHRLILFERCGLDVAVVLVFDKHLASCEPEDFVKECLVKKIHATGVLLGHDTRFGRNARGDFDLLSRLGQELEFETCSVPVVELDGMPVSSTRIRQAIQAGDLPLAERMLGRRVTVLGTVIPGTCRGKGLGYPTANLDLHHEVRPPEAVYATNTLVDGIWMDSVTNIGRPPSLLPAGPLYASEKIAVETHILDFSGELYGKDLEVRFVGRLRGQKVFRSGQALAEQISSDLQAARALLADAQEASEADV